MAAANAALHHAYGMKWETCVVCGIGQHILTPNSSYSDVMSGALGVSL